MTTQLVDVTRWHRWLESRNGTTRWNAWAQQHPELEGWTVPQLLSPEGSDRTDAMQAALVALAQQGDGDAAHVLLVQLRPGLNRLARWTVGAGLWPWHESAGEVRAAFFETLYRHPLDRRPRKIAANLVLDTRQRVQRAERSTLAALPHRSAEPGPDRAGGAQQPEHRDPTSNLAVLTTIRAAVDRLPGSRSSRDLTATMAYRAWILDQSRATIAADLGLGPQTVSTRLHRLRSVLDRRDLQC